MMLLFIILVFITYSCKKFFTISEIPIHSSHKFISLPLKSSFSFKGLFISFTYTRLGDINIVVHYNNDIMEYVRSLLPNIPWSSFFRFSNSPRPGFPSPYIPRKTIYNQDTINHITSNNYTSVTDVKVNIANYIQNINDHLLSDTLFKLFNIMFHNLPVFMGIIAVILYSLLPWIMNLSNQFISYTFNKYNNTKVECKSIYSSGESFISYLINEYVLSNLHHFHKIRVFFYTFSHQDFNVRNADFLVQFHNRTARYRERANNYIQNRAYVLNYINNIYANIAAYSQVLNEFRGLGGNFNHINGETTSLITALIGTNPIHRERLVYLYNNLNNYVELIRYDIFNAATTLGQNSAMIYRELLGYDNIDYVDLYGELYFIMNNYGFVTRYDFSQVLARSRNNYLNQNRG